MRTFGTVLREERKKRELTQAQLAKKIGIHKNTIHHYEKDEVDPTLLVLICFADYFDVSLDYLVGRKDTDD